MVLARPRSAPLRVGARRAVRRHRGRLLAGHLRLGDGAGDGAAGRVHLADVAVAQERRLHRAAAPRRATPRAGRPRRHGLARPDDRRREVEDEHCAPDPGAGAELRSLLPCCCWPRATGQPSRSVRGGGSPSRQRDGVSDSTWPCLRATSRSSSRSWGARPPCGLTGARGVGVAAAADRAGGHRRFSGDGRGARVATLLPDRLGAWRPHVRAPSTSSRGCRQAPTRTPGGAPGAAVSTRCASCRSPSRRSGAGVRVALVSLVQTTSGPVIVGSWQSAGAGLDIALWHPSGERWVRSPSTGTPLASTGAELVSPRGATADLDGVLRRRLRDPAQGEQRDPAAAVWRVARPDGPWTRTDLPHDGSLGQADAAACDDIG